MVKLSNEEQTQDDSAITDPIITPNYNPPKRRTFITTAVQEPVPAATAADT